MDGARKGFAEIVGGNLKVVSEPADGLVMINFGQPPHYIAQYFGVTVEQVKEAEDDYRDAVRKASKTAEESKPKKTAKSKGK